VKQYNILVAALLISLIIFPATIVHAQAEPPVVHAVLFYSPTCGHCELVINGTILPMIEKYGDQLQIIGIDVTQQEGQVFFMSAMQKFNLESAGVPFLVIDNMYLVGSLDIPEKFPGLVETYLAQGGVDWPNIPELLEAIAHSSEAGTATAAVANAQTDIPTATVPVPSGTVQTTPVPAIVSPSVPSSTATPDVIGLHTETSNWRDIFSRDQAGNTLSVFVLLGMLGSIAWAVILFRSTNGTSLKGNWAWSIPLLCVIGFGVAGYLAYIETTNTTAVCGPVGDCNTVQQSKYARLFGILPIGVLGLVGYVAIFVSWLIARYARNNLANFAVIFLFTMTAFGTLFSIYLTFLEPFVIGATCAWCLTSAILMTILMLLTVRPAKTAIPGFI
jgi:uncharacterized membrane protein